MFSRINQIYRGKKYHIMILLLNKMDSFSYLHPVNKELKYEDEIEIRSEFLGYRFMYMVVLIGVSQI